MTSQDMGRNYVFFSTFHRKAPPGASVLFLIVRNAYIISGNLSWLQEILIAYDKPWSYEKRKLAINTLYVWLNW